MDVKNTVQATPLYHGTRDAAARIILPEGFRRSRSRSCTGTGICLSESLTVAYEYGIHVAAEDMCLQPCSGTCRSRSAARWRRRRRYVCQAKLLRPEFQRPVNGLESTVAPPPPRPSPAQSVCQAARQRLKEVDVVVAIHDIVLAAHRVEEAFAAAAEAGGALRLDRALASAVGDQGKRLGDVLAELHGALPRYCFFGDDGGVQRRDDGGGARHVQSPVVGPIRQCLLMQAGTPYRFGVTA